MQRKNLQLLYFKLNQIFMIHNISREYSSTQYYYLNDIYHLFCYLDTIDADLRRGFNITIRTISAMDIT